MPENTVNLPDESFFFSPVAYPQNSIEQKHTPQTHMEEAHLML